MRYSRKAGASLRFFFVCSLSFLCITTEEQAVETGVALFKLGLYTAAVATILIVPPGDDATVQHFGRKHQISGKDGVESNLNTST